MTVINTNLSALSRQDRHDRVDNDRRGADPRWSRTDDGDHIEHRDDASD